MRRCSQSWELRLRAERKSAATIKLDDRGVRLYLKWCNADGSASLDRASVDGFVADLLANGREPATAHAYQKALRQYAKWLTADGELESALGLDGQDRNR